MRGHLLPLYYQLSSQQKRSRSRRRINRHVSSISSVQISSANRWTNYLCLHRPSKPQRKKTDLGKHSKLTPNSSSTIYMAKVYRYWERWKAEKDPKYAQILAIYIPTCDRDSVMCHHTAFHIKDFGKNTRELDKSMKLKNKKGKDYHRLLCQ